MYLIIGIITVALIFLIVKSQKNNYPQTSTDSKNKKVEIDFPPKPKWKPDLKNDIEKIYNKTKYYTESKLQFAIFENGTVVMFPKKTENIEEEAKLSLNKIYTAHPDFNPSQMDDGNYIIQYIQPAFTIVFKNEIEKNWEYIDANHQDGLCGDEVLLNSKNEPNTFDIVGKIGLFGRAKMFMDAQHPKVVRIFDLSETS
jgi:hypothetical protein